VTRHLITGAGGFIGSALANALIERGDEVVAFDRFSRGKEDRLADGVQIYPGDIRYPGLVELAAANCDAIWHLAYIQGTQTFYAEPREVIDVALRGILNVLDAAEGKDFFLVSSSEVYQEPPEYPTDETVPLVVPDVTNPRYSYGAGKIASEVATFAHADRLNRAVIVRPHNIYGPDMGTDHVIPQFVERMRDTPHGGDFPIQGTGEETRSFCYIWDCVGGLLTLYDKGEGGNVYHLGNPDEEYEIGRLAEIIGAHFNQKIRVVPGELPKGSPTRRAPDISKLAALGYKPQIDIATGLRYTIPWYVSNR
jgi:nucleoside-diphosphate-sugar epimerase